MKVSLRSHLSSQLTLVSCLLFKMITKCLHRTYCLPSGSACMLPGSAYSLAWGLLSSTLEESTAWLRFSTALTVVMQVLLQTPPICPQQLVFLKSTW